MTAEACLAAINHNLWMPLIVCVFMGALIALTAYVVGVRHGQGDYAPFPDLWTVTTTTTTTYPIGDPDGAPSEPDPVSP